MAIAAVPSYMGTDFRTAAPGHRFSMYFKLWGTDQKSEAKKSALDEALKLNDSDRKTLDALLARQSSLAEALEHRGQLVSFSALSVAPFATGLGLEHPLENGFAFLTPYGLPYLPGSGVKGVLRRSAQELANGLFGANGGWTPEAITALFGKESDDGDDTHQRGALCFWDVIPKLAGNMKVDVMTPHQTTYYTGASSPHDCGSPNPICFLTVPPGAGFNFNVQCSLSHLHRVAADLAQDQRWAQLLESAFEHAYQWLGFGAKTAVGYGAMKIDRAKEEARRLRIAEQERQRQQVEAERQRQAAELARRLAQDEANALENARFSALSPSQQLLELTKRALVALNPAIPLSRQVEREQELRRKINELIDQSASWSEPAERGLAADILEQAYGLLGWSEKDKDKKKQEKQRAKKQSTIDALRSGKPE